MRCGGCLMPGALKRRRIQGTSIGVFVAVLLSAATVLAQPGTRASTPASTAEPEKDPLGRDTPRGTVLGFIAAARKEPIDVAVQYLNTRLRDTAANDLAHQLFVVLDSRLPARLNELSDRPEGSRPNPLKPDQDIVGTITTGSGPIEILVERVSRGGEPSVWLFAGTTLDAIPDVYAEIDHISVDRYLPDFLTRPRIAGVRLLAWLVLLLIVPLLYRVIGVLSALLNRGIFLVRGKKQTEWLDLLSGPVRLLLLAITIRWLPVGFDVPLLERQFWSAVAATLVILALGWLALRVNAAGERYLHRRVAASAVGDIAAILRLVRRLADVLIVAAAGIAALHYFGIDPTAALAGLGIGGIAVALAAQKTLENVIGGISIIFDKAVRVGDILKLGEMSGSVDSIGLRSTRIRTPDRTIVSVPNGQIANINIETLSARDKFWFHHFVGLRYETTSAQMRSVVDEVRTLLVNHPAIDPELIRVRFFRLGAFSLDIEISTYIIAVNWEHFLDIQQDLLLRVMEIVERNGSMIALPSQTLRFIDDQASEPVGSLPGRARVAQQVRERA